MPKAKKKAKLPKEEVMTASTDMTQTDPSNNPGPDDNTSLAPSFSSNSSYELGAISKVEFLEAKVQWQDKMIKDLEEERNFLRAQILGGNKKSTQPKVVAVKEDDNDGDMEEDDLPSSPNISESSDSDVISPKWKPRHTQSPASGTLARPGRAHTRVKGPAEVIRRYQSVLKTFRSVRTMTEAFRINGVDRGTIKMTAPIAELQIVDPETFNSLKFNPATETLLSFARKCATHITPEKKTIIEDMKSRGKLLPLLMKY